MLVTMVVVVKGAGVDGGNWVETIVGGGCGSACGGNCGESSSGN